MSLKPKAGILGSEGSANYIPFPSNPINPATGKLYTFEEIQTIKEETIAYRNVFYEIWNEYMRLMDNKNRFGTPKDRRELRDYEATNWPDLVAIKKAIESEIVSGTISEDEGIAKWGLMRTQYMTDVAQAEYARRKREKEELRLASMALQSLRSREQASLVPQQSLASRYPFYNGEKNPILTGKPQRFLLSFKPKGSKGGSRRRLSRRHLSKKRRQTNRKQK